MPQASFAGEYLHTDVFQMAAAYLFHITQNHPFIDGNKRAGAVADYVFLSINGLELQVTNDEFESLVLQVARGELDKSGIAAFFVKHCIDVT
jgi:death-on-curing protein